MGMTCWYEVSRAMGAFPLACLVIMLSLPVLSTPIATGNGGDERMLQRGFLPPVCDKFLGGDYGSHDDDGPEDRQNLRDCSNLVESNYYCRDSRMSGYNGCQAPKNTLSYPECIAMAQVINVSIIAVEYFQETIILNPESQCFLAIDFASNEEWKLCEDFNLTTVSGFIGTGTPINSHSFLSDYNCTVCVDISDSDNNNHGSNIYGEKQRNCSELIGPGHCVDASSNTSAYGGCLSPPDFEFDSYGECMKLAEVLRSAVLGVEYNRTTKQCKLLASNDDLIECPTGWMLVEGTSIEFPGDFSTSNQVTCGSCAPNATYGIDFDSECEQFIGTGTCEDVNGEPYNACGMVVGINSLQACQILGARASTAVGIEYVGSVFNSGSGTFEHRGGCSVLFDTSETDLNCTNVGSDLQAMDGYSGIGYPFGSDYVRDSWSTCYACYPIDNNLSDEPLRSCSNLVGPGSCADTNGDAYKGCRSPITMTDTECFEVAATLKGDVVGVESTDRCFIALNASSPTVCPVGWAEKEEGSATGHPQSFISLSRTACYTCADEAPVSPKDCNLNPMAGWCRDVSGNSYTSCYNGDSSWGEFDKCVRLAEWTEGAVGVEANTWHSARTCSILFNASSNGAVNCSDLGGGFTYVESSGVGSPVSTEYSPFGHCRSCSLEEA